jgi:hypothetical protein
MENTELQPSFIREWLKMKKGEEKYNQLIIDAIEKSLGGLMNEELDEANLLALLLGIKYRGGND